MLTVGPEALLGTAWGCQIQRYDGGEEEEDTVLCIFLCTKGNTS